MSTTEHKPIKTFRAGGINASIFENMVEVNGEKKSIPSVSFQKRYTDKNGMWQSTNQLNANDIPRAIFVLTEAYRFLLQDESHGSEAKP